MTDADLERAPGASSIDLRLPALGRAVLKGFEAEPPPFRYLMAVLPTGGRHADARLFSFRRVDGENVVRLARGGALAAGAPGWMCVPAPTLDAAVARRLWERGEHVGDVLVEGRKDAYGRPEAMALLYHDLSRGMTAADRLVIPFEVRRAMAATFAGSDEALWRDTADALDPAALLRQGRASAERETFTLEALDAFLRESAESERPSPRAFGAAEGPDFRFQDDAVLLAELRRAPEVLRYAQPHLDPEDGMIGTLLRRIPELADALERGDGEAARRVRGQMAWMTDRALRFAAGRPGEAPEAAGETAILRLLRGDGTGAGYFHDVMGEGGLADVAARRAADRSADDAVKAALDGLREKPAERGFSEEDAERLRRLALEPALILRAAPDRLSRLSTTLGVPDLSRRLPALALKEGPLSDGEGAAESLTRAFARRPRDMERLAARTLALAEAVGRMTAFGSRDQDAAPAAAALLRGAAALKAARLRAAPRRQAAEAREISARLADAPVVLPARSGLAVRGELRRADGSRAEFVAFGRAARLMRGLQGGEAVRVLAREGEWKGRPQLQVLEAVRDHAAEPPADRAARA